MSTAPPTASDLLVQARSEFYQFTLRDKIAGALSALRLRFFPRRVLVAGPFVGEFGHELMDWQAWVRAMIDRYREVHVITYPGRDFLYPGCRIHTHEITLETAGYKHGRFTPAQLAEMAHAKARELGLRDYDVFTPAHLCTQYHRRFVLPAKWVVFEQPPIGGEMRDLAFHFRWLHKAGPDQTRNYAQDRCDRLAALCQQHGYRICCLGHPKYSYCPPGVEDLRSDDLRTSTAALCSARLLVGELSGPMHLAQLCGQPILIWADGQWRLDNCERWNVFRVPTYIVANDTHQPEPERILESLQAAMADLQRRTEGFARPAYRLPN